MNEPTFPTTGQQAAAFALFLAWVAAIYYVAYVAGYYVAVGFGAVSPSSVGWACVLAFLLANLALGNMRGER